MENQKETLHDVALIRLRKNGLNALDLSWSLCSTIITVMVM